MKAQLEEDELVSSPNTAMPFGGVIAGNWGRQAPAFAWVSTLLMPIAILGQKDDSLVFSNVSRGFLSATGLSLPEVLDRRLDEVLPEAARNIEQCARQAAFSGQSAKATVAFRTSGRRSERFSIAIQPLEHEHRFAMEATRLNEKPPPNNRRQTALFDQLRPINRGVFYIYKLHGALNVDFSTLLGFPEGDPEARGERILRLMHPDDTELFASHRARLETMPDSAFAAVHLRLRNYAGEWRWLEARERIYSRNKRGLPDRILGFVSDVTEQRRLMQSLSAASKALLDAEARERRRIARELHDSMAQHLVAIDLTLSRLERRPDNDPEQAAIIADARSALTFAHREVRTFSYLLHPPDIERLGLEATMRKFLDGFAARTGLSVKLKVGRAPLHLDSVGKLAFFRIAQEALMNTHKHADATTVEVRLWNAGDVSMLEVRDDGRGMAAGELDMMLAEGSGGVGIAGMRARMEQLGGALMLKDGRRGFCVLAKLPTHREETP